MTHSAQMLMKSRLAGAQKGHGLLKKKADALQMRFRQILGKIIEVSLKWGFLIIFRRIFRKLIFRRHLCIELNFDKRNSMFSDQNIDG